MYIVTEQELRELLQGKIQVEELITPEKRALVTWLGESVMMLIEEDLKINPDELITLVQKELSRCGCSMCIKSAFEEVVYNITGEREDI